VGEGGFATRRRGGLQNVRNSTWDRHGVGQKNQHIVIRKEGKKEKHGKEWTEFLAAEYSLKLAGALGVRLCGPHKSTKR